MDSLGLLLRVVASLAAVLGLVWMVRRGMLRGQGGRARAAVGSISVLARQQLTNRASVALVQVGGTGLVLGVTDSSVQVLASRPVDELLAQPVEAAPQPAPRGPRAVASRPAPRRLLPTSRREVIALPALVAAPAGEPPVVVTPVTAPAAAEVLPVEPRPAQPAVPAVAVAPAAPVEVLPPAPAGAGSLPGSEPLYEELRRRAAAVADLPRQESRGAAAPAPGAASVPAPVTVASPASVPAPRPVSFDAQLGAALEEDATVPAGTPAAALPVAALPVDALPAAADPRADGRPRRARHGARASGPLSGSALSPSTWVQAVGAVRDLAGRR
ncbi:flagellar biosynthetic protein FliO [Pseudokineococcus marinus]|uniref:FliO/MopB family protein n=1 Tax=Pseudokineococcus marinus TaxID=351215 RepID=UPI0030A063FF